MDMLGIKVTYTVQESYAEHNKQNIGDVMVELRTLDRDDIRYAVFVEPDGRTFNHIAFRKDSESFKLDTLNSFQKFLKELNTSNPEKPPVATQLSVVDSSYALF